MELVDNIAVRRAVAGFAAEPGQRRLLEVLRHCMYGQLLFDVTGSDAPVAGAVAFPAGSSLQLRGGTGPDGGRALFTYTRHAEIERHHPPGTGTQSFVTPALGALELARHQRDSWLYIDPAGPTCALSAAEIDFALRNPRNTPLKDALVALHAGRDDRRHVVELLRQDAPLLMAADESTGQKLARSTRLSDGSTALFGFTSAPEVVAVSPRDAVVSMTTTQVLDMARRNGHRGVVIDPAGPSIAIMLTELDDDS